MPNRFERMVDTAHWNASADREDCLKLLRRQHAAMVRLVKRQPRYGHGIGENLVIDSNGPFIDIDDLLAALAAWRKGTR